MPDFESLVAEPSDHKTRPDDNEKERQGLTSAITTPHRSHSSLAPRAHSWRFPSKTKWRVMAACVQCFANGVNDSAPGALIPVIEDFYKVNYSIVSTIFVAIAVGFIIAAFCVDIIDKKLGRSITLMLCDALCIIGYFMMVFGPPFPVYVVGYFFCGFGQAINLALNNVYCANLRGATVVLGIFHGAYGIGGAIAPIVATSIISAGSLFTRFYIFTIALRALSLALTGWTFWGFEKEIEELATRHYIETGQTNESLPKTSGLQTLTKALRKRATIIGALFIFAYQGAEVTDAGWITSFLINVRHGDPYSVGYVPSGFWAGIALGRLGLSYIAFRWTVEVSFTYVVVAAAVGMQLVSWLVANVVGSAIGVALVGLFIGPIYPCATTVFARLLDRDIQETSIAFITSSGSAGGAIWPLVTGIISQTSGIWVLHPICVGLLVLMEICWGGLVFRTDGKLAREKYH